jgi:parvulin-like peptidyl-prolyl isomerase
MAKKGTVGGPRKRSTTAEDIERRKRYRSRAEKDRYWQRWAMFAIVVMVIASVAVLVGAVFYQQYWRPHQAITTVNGVEVSTQNFQENVRFTRWFTANQIRDLYYLTGGNTQYLDQLAGQQINNLRYPSLMGSQVLSQMEEDIILKQAAQEMGITIDQAAVDREVNDYMASRVGLTEPDSPTATPTVVPTITPTPLVSPTPSNTPQPTATATASPTPENMPTMTPGPSLTPTETLTPTMTPTATATLEPDMIRATVSQEESGFYKAAKSTADVNQSVIRDVFYYQALRTAVMDAIGKDVPTEQLQVDARHILIAFNPDIPAGQTAPPPTDEQKQAALDKANEVMAAIQAGEPFADLAQAVSNDTGSASQGGELGWSTPDKFVPEFADAVTNAEIGQIIGPIESQYGYHIIQVHAREVRALSPSDLSTARSDAYQKWLDEQKAAASIKRRSDWLNRIPDTPTYNSLLGDILPAQ